MNMMRWALPAFLIVWLLLTGLIVYGWYTPDGLQSEHWQESWYQLMLGLNIVSGLLIFLMLYLQRRSLTVIADAMPDMVEHGVGYQIRNAERYGEEAQMFNRLSRRLASTLAEMEAKRSLLSETLDNVDGVILMVDGRGNVDLITPYVEVIFGWNPELLTEHPVSLLLPEYAEITSRLAANATEFPPEGVLVPTIAHCENGEVRGVQLLLQLRTAAPGYVLLVRDVTLELEAEREAGLLKSALDVSSDGVLLFDDHGQLSWANQTASDLLTDGSEPIATNQDYVAIMTRALVNGRFPDAVVEPDSWLAAAGKLHDEAANSRDLLHQNGRWLREQSTRTRHGGTLTMFTDITEEKEGQLLSEEKRQLAETACEERSQFLTVMSHEIRTPLNGMLGMLELIQDEKDPAQARHFCDVAVKAGKSLNTLVNELLDLSQLNEKKLVLNPAPCNLSGMVADVLELMQPLADAKGIELKVHNRSPLPEWLMLDEGRVRQILLNLMGNAIKFTETGQVTLKLVADKQALQCSVCDTGPGIAPEQVAMLFDAFKRLDTGFSRQQSGAGLGLTISQRLAECMDTTIEVESAVGRGSCFSFKLSVEVTSAPDVEAEVNTGTAAYRCNILVAEDNEVNSLIAQQMLEREGHNVTLVDNGKKALEQLQQSDFDLVLMDISMPEMDGITATRLIREQGKTLPIIAMTAHNRQTEVDQFLESGMNDHLAKPCRRLELRAMIERWVEPSSLTVPSPLEHQSRADENQEPELASEQEAPPVLLDAVTGKPASDSVDLRVLKQMAQELEPEILPELISIFVRNVRLQQETISEALSEQDHESMQRETHSLKSSAAAYGLTRIQTLAQEVEELCKAGDFDQIESPASKLLDELEPALMELEQLDYRLI